MATRNLKLNQVLVQEKSTKDRVFKELTQLHKNDQKAGAFDGFHRVYEKKDEAGEDFPAESKKVQTIAEDVLQRAAHLYTEVMDITAQKDRTNCDARASLQIGDHVFPDLPATFLLFLENKLIEMKDIIDKMPTLDPAEDWTFDTNARFHKTQATRVHKTKKVQKALVLYPATEKHPAQTQLITEDETVGHWATIKHSSALPAQRKLRLLERVEKMIATVRMCREEANLTPSVETHIGKAVFQYLLEA